MSREKKLASNVGSNAEPDLYTLQQKKKVMDYDYNYFFQKCNWLRLPITAPQK